MKIETKVKNDGAKCELSVTIKGADLVARFDERLQEVAANARLPGFRPGKSPAALIRRRYGVSVLGETIEKAMEESAEKAMKDNDLRPSQQPTADVKEKYDLESLDAKKDFEYTLSFEPLPKIELADFKAMSFERLLADPEDKDIEESLKNLAQARTKEGEDAPALDDEFAKELGQDDIETLRKLIKDNLASEIEQGSKTRIKMAVMDELDKAHKIDAPPTMIEREYDAIIQHAEREASAHVHDENCDHDHNHDADADKKSQITDEEKAEFREIAGRRVRLGLVLAEIAEKNNLAVSNTELQQAVIQRAKAFPGHEEQMYNMIVGNQQMLESIRAPLLEDKAVDFVLELASVTERKSTTDEIFEDPEEGEKPKKSDAAAKKKTPAKKPAAKKTATKAKPKTAAKPKAKKES